MPFNSTNFRMRHFGQTKLPSSFISTSSQEAKVKPLKKQIPLSEFLDKKLGKTSGRSLKEKKISIASIKCDSKELGDKKNGDGSDLMGKDAIFRQFSVPLKEKDEFELVGGAENEKKFARKRKKPTEFSSGNTSNHQNHLVVLGDDPKPKQRPRRSEPKPMDMNAKTTYNHYASGHGWWDGGREGIDSEEVGSNETWEGVGSTTLGGLEWH